MNREAFAAGLDDLLQDKARARQLGENGLQLVSTRYDFPAYIAGLETMFARAMGECSHGVRQSPPLAGGYSSEPVVTVPA